MARRSTKEQEGTPMEETIDTEGSLDSSDSPAPAVEEPKAVERDLSPMEGTLHTVPEEQPPLAKMSKEQIEATIQEKLSRKTDSPGSDPFVPNTQLENEVKDLAKAKGFPLTRGTEIGARLLARSQRTKK